MPGRRGFMILDANCAIGHWPFRRLWTTTAEGLLQMLDGAGIDRAVVCHTHAVFYRDPHASNAELRDAVRPHRDRLIPLAALAPDYAGWRDDLRQCVEEWGMRGLRLYPGYHRYDLGGDAAAELLAEAERLGLPVSVGCAFEDPRQRHPLDTAPDVTEHAIGAAARRFPGVRFLCTNAPLTTIDMVARHVPHQQNVCFDTSALPGPLSDAIQQAYALLGPARLLLGTHAPFKYPQVGLLRVHSLAGAAGAGPDAAALDAILGRNALRLFGS
jgi:predicted TIM-barrel fold metal-dependent hydrolase